MKKGAALTRIARLTTTRTETLEDMSKFSHNPERKQEVSAMRSLLGDIEGEILSLRCKVMESNLSSIVNIEDEAVPVYRVIILRQLVALRIQDLKKMLVLSNSKETERRIEEGWETYTIPSLFERGSIQPKLRISQGESQRLDEILQEHNWTVDI